VGAGEWVGQGVSCPRLPGLDSLCVGLQGVVFPGVQLRRGGGVQVSNGPGTMRTNSSLLPERGNDDEVGGEGNLVLLYFSLVYAQGALLMQEYDYMIGW
jgi:hypothetical protein